ncbi:hypothetical protein [Dapis sp. BLCC M126]
MRNLWWRGGKFPWRCLGKKRASQILLEKSEFLARLETNVANFSWG